MLKRSFAEFHAQKAIVGHRQKIKNLDATLSELKALDWPDCPEHCERSMLRRYFDNLQRLRILNEQLMPMALSNGKVQRTLTNGRGVLLMDKESGLLQIGMMLIESDTVGTRSKKSMHPTSPVFTVLYLHKPGPWDNCLIQSTEPQSNGGQYS